MTRRPPAALSRSRPVRVVGVYVSGDDRATSSIQGVLVSGRRAADAVLANRLQRTVHRPDRPLPGARKSPASPPEQSALSSPDRGRGDREPEGSTMSALNYDVLRAIQIERLRKAMEARRARGVGR